MDYSVTHVICFDKYSDTAPHPKTMRGDGITNFIFHVLNVSLSIIKNIFTASFIAESS